MPPVNDDIANAVDLGSDPSGYVVFDITDATVEAGETDLADGHTVWFKFTAPADGVYVFDTAATPPPRWDSLIAAYIGGPTIADLSFLGYDDDGLLQDGVSTADGFGTSMMTPSLAAGTVLWLQVNSYDYAAESPNPSAGYPRDDCVLRWYPEGEPPPPPPTNPPTVTSVTPDPQVVGREIVLTGTNFDTATAVDIGGATASFTIDSPTQITATIPLSAVPGLVTVTNLDGNGSHSFTPLYPGPWRQPDDRWGAWIASPLTDAQTWLTEWDGLTFPAYPAATFIPDPETAAEGWALHQTATESASLEDPHWTLRVTNFAVAIPIAADLAVSPDTWMPLIPPSDDELAPSDVYDFEYEGHGDPLGPVDTALTFSDGLEAHEHAIGTATPSDFTEVETAEIRAFRLAASDYDLDVGLVTFDLTHWLSGPYLTGLQQIAAKPVSGDGLDETQVSEVHTTTVRQDTDLAAGESLTLDDLDGTDGVYAVGFAVSVAVDESPVTYPAWVSSLDNNTPVEKGAGIDGGVFAVQARAQYRPTRYRLLYTHPLGRPPLAHRQRLDGVASNGPPLAHLQSGTGAQRPPVAHRQQTP